MNIRHAVLSVVVPYKGQCFQWLVLFDAKHNMEYKYRVGSKEMASDWVESQGILSPEDREMFETIIPDLPTSDGQGAVDAQIERNTADELARKPLPGWKPIEWFRAGLPNHIEVHITRRFK